jgi:NAD(P)-dependent dehydrogenase (short-subunit alcohol dehydrogenase family)
MGTPEDIGGICVFLASERASYINGTTIWADGGGT